MGTHAMIEFKDETESKYVFQHFDGYPDGVIPGIKDAMEFAWHLPRFEADDFSAAFIAANKPKGGGQIRIGSKEGIECCDYHYIVNHTGEIEVISIGEGKIGSYNLYDLRTDSINSGV